MVVCLQNHDQVGNRAFGDRLHHTVDGPLFRALTVLLLCAPETPLLFMGQEWAASTPFLYFTDHAADLGRLVTDGRRREFARFAAFQDEAGRASIPDPQAPATWAASRLVWEERGQPDHAAMLDLHRTLLRLRRTEGALGADGDVAVTAPDSHTVLMRRQGLTGEVMAIAARLRGAGAVELGHLTGGMNRWAVVMTSEDAPFVPGATGLVPIVDPSTGVVHFRRPSAVVLRGT
jgi:maltooligosyltrehalose trehalohydrolase